MALTKDFRRTVVERARRDPVFAAELRATLFSIVTAPDFLRKVQDDLSAVQERIDDPGRALNCILSAYHLHEWVWGRWMKARAPLTVRGTMIRDKTAFIKWLELNCPYFNVLQDLANGAKHCSPVHSTDKIEGYGMGPYGIGPFGSSYLLIDLGDNFPNEERYLVADALLEEIVVFWSGLFADLTIT